MPSLELEGADPREGSYDYSRPCVAGWYKATVIQQKVGPTKKEPVRNMLTVGFGVEAGFTGGNEGGVRLDYYVVEPNKGSRNRTTLLNGLGYSWADKGTKAAGRSFTTEELVGLQAEVKVGPGKLIGNDGLPRNEIKDIRPIAGPDTPTRLFEPTPPKDEIDETGDIPFDVPQGS